STLSSGLWSHDRVGHLCLPGVDRFRHREPYKFTVSDTRGKGETAGNRGKHLRSVPTAATLGSGHAVPAGPPARRGTMEDGPADPQATDPMKNGRPCHRSWKPARPPRSASATSASSPTSTTGSRHWPTG